MNKVSFKCQDGKGSTATVFVNDIQIFPERIAFIADANKTTPMYIVIDMPVWVAEFETGDSMMEVSESTKAVLMQMGWIPPTPKDPNEDSST